MSKIIHKPITSKIILEGVDGSGKSTLAESIQKAFPDMNYKIVHLTRHTPNNRDYFQSLLFSKDNIIFDRFHIGQFIYQTEEQREINGWMNINDLIELENLINHMKAIVKIIYVNTPTETCLANCKKDSEDSHYTYEYIESLKNKYANFIKNSSNEIMIYDNNFSVTDPDIAKNFDYSTLPYIIACDFDGVLATDCFPFIDKAIPNINLINDLIKERNNGKKVVLWTCRTDNVLNDAIEFCKKYGLEFDAINDNVEEIKKIGLNPRKVYCDEYIDDKAAYLCFNG